MNFFAGRYGSDHLGVALIFLSIFVEILGRILGMYWIYLIGLAIFLWELFRMFSRNIAARMNENQKFLAFFGRFKNRAQYKEQRRQTKQQKKDGTYTYSKEEQAKENEKGKVYCYYYCPSCKQQVRVPAGMGKIKVKCPKCGNKFDSFS